MAIVSKSFSLAPEVDFPEPGALSRSTQSGWSTPCWACYWPPAS